MLLIGSVRKTFSVGFALNELGRDRRFETPVQPAVALLMAPAGWTVILS